MTNYDIFPLPELVDEIKRYIERGDKPPTELLALALENNLLKAMTGVTESQLGQLQDICLWLYTEAPGSCFSSPDKVRSWIARGGKHVQNVGHCYTKQLGFMPAETD